MYINQICNFINKELLENAFKGANFKDVKAFPVCYTYKISNKDRNYYKTSDGELIQLEYGDSSDIVMYHKIVNINNDFKGGFGDSMNINSISNMQLIIIYKDDAINLNKSSDNICNLIQTNFPKKITNEMKSLFKFTSNNIKIADINPNTSSLLTQEYQGIETINTKINIASIDYKINSIFSSKCIENCNC